MIEYPLNDTEFKVLQDSIMEYCTAKSKLDDEKEAIKSILTNHLKRFFDFEAIVFDEEFERITLRFRKDDGVVVRSNISELRMDWTVRSSIDRMANRVLLIDVYPFRLPDKQLFWVDDELMWDD